MASRHAIWAALLWLALGVAITLAAPHAAPVRLGLGGGWLTAGVSSLTAFSLLAWSHPRSTQSALGAVTVGFLARAALLAVGLLAAQRRGADAIWFTASFFGTYLPLQAIEIAGALSMLKRLPLVSAGVQR